MQKSEQLWKWVSKNSREMQISGVVWQLSTKMNLISVLTNFQIRLIEA